MKPKMYRKNKKIKGSEIASFKDTSAGGPVKFVDGPETSVGQKSGQCIETAHVEDGSKKVVGAKS
jgi:hypothetical protein